GINEVAVDSIPRRRRVTWSIHGPHETIHGIGAKGWRCETRAATRNEGVVGRAVVNADAIDVRIEQARLYPQAIPAPSRIRAGLNALRILYIARTPIGICPTRLEKTSIRVL